jgi:hypothetical protein
MPVIIRALRVAGASCLVILSSPAASAADLRWAYFVPPAATASGATVNPIALSEKPGDARFESLSVADGLLQVTGRLGDAQGSRWLTLGMDVAANAAASPVDASSARQLRIRLASATPQVLRIRLKGPDRRIQAAGCYPVMMQRVTAEPLDYAIPLDAFSAEAWCGEQGATVPQTLVALTHVEVTVNEPSARPHVLRVGRIELVEESKAEAHAAEASAPAATARRAAKGPEAPKKAAPAKPAVTAAPVHHVVCERNRLGLMMCY